MLAANNINPKTFAQYDHQITDNQYSKEKLSLHSYDLVAVQNKEQKTVKTK